jgi:hypothetical protein
MPDEGANKVLSLIYRYKWVFALLSFMLLGQFMAQDKTKPLAIERNRLPDTDYSSTQIGKVKALPSAKMPTTQPLPNIIQSKYVVKETPAVANVGLTVNQQSMGFSDPDIYSVDERFRESAIRRIPLENVLDDIGALEQVLTDDQSPIVRNAAMERILQLEPEYEQKHQVTRSSKEPGIFLPSVLKGLEAETDPIAIQSALEYIGLYGEKNQAAFESVNSLLDRADIDPPTAEFAAELLVENFGQNPVAIKQRILDRQNIEGNK